MRTPRKIRDSQLVRRLRRSMSPSKRMSKLDKDVENDSDNEEFRDASTSIRPTTSGLIEKRVRFNEVGVEEDRDRSTVDLPNPIPANIEFKVDEKTNPIELRRVTERKVFSSRLEILEIAVHAPDHESIDCIEKMMQGQRLEETTSTNLEREAIDYDGTISTASSSSGLSQERLFTSGDGNSEYDDEILPWAPRLLCDWDWESMGDSDDDDEFDNEGDDCIEGSFELA